MGPGETENKEKAEARTGDTEDKKKPAEDDANVSKGDDDADKTHDPYYPPVITLPEVNVSSGEEDEEEIFKLRKHEVTGWIRLVMRREKTLKLCANLVVKS